MLLNRYDFSCQIKTTAKLPYYKGSTFRGVFGRALKKVVCALKREECENCLLNAKCVYAQVFEPLVHTSGQKSRIASPPHPFVIEPPLTSATDFPPESKFDFSLLLIGEVNNSLPYFIYAFEQMGQIGIGKKMNGKRGRFALRNVYCDNTLIYSSKDQKLNSALPGKRVRLKDFTDSKQREFRLKLALKTPLRLKFKNKLHADLPFHILVRAMLRRVSSLMNTYGQGEPRLDYSGLVKKAETVKIIDNNLTWFDWQRYSFRRKEKMLMGGMTGSVTYEGAMGEYLPLIEFCEQIHLGKQTTFGLGNIKAERLP